MQVLRVISTAVVGMFLLAFIAVDLIIFGVLATNNVLVTLLPVMGLLVGGALGLAIGQSNARRLRG